MLKPAVNANLAPTGGSARVRPRSRCPAWLLAVLLALVTMALYWPATRCDFVNLDDQEFVTENPHVQSGLSWETVKWAFRNTEQAACWAPLVWLSHSLACQWFGLNPWGHHLINVLLHTASTVLVFLVFRQMTGTTWPCLILAALFGLHPLRVESVAWVSERKDALSTFFWMLALGAYAGYVEAARTGNSRSRTWYASALAMFALGLLSKPMLVTLPCCLLLLDYWPLNRFKAGRAWPLVVEKIPFFALAAAAGVATFVVQKQGGVLAPVESLPLGARCGNALVSYCRYLLKLCWPTDLAVFYPHPGYWPVGQVLLAGGLLAGVSGLLLLNRRRYPFLLMGWLWFCGTLAPVIQLVQFGEVSMADRFTYVPSLGMLILAIWGARELTARWRRQAVVSSAAALAAGALCSGRTRQQLGYWKDSESLFRHALEVTDNNYFAHKGLADALAKQGRMEDAIGQYQEAIGLHPGFADAQYNLGNALLQQGRTEEAIGRYRDAIRLKPGFADPHNNLGDAFRHQGQIDAAIDQYREAIRLKSDCLEARYNLGNALRNKGRIEEAIGQYQEIIRLKPNDAEAHNNLGVAFAMKGQIPPAIVEFQAAVRLKSDYAEARNNLARALSTKPPPAAP